MKYFYFRPESDNLKKAKENDSKNGNDLRNFRELSIKYSVRTCQTKLSYWLSVFVWVWIDAIEYSTKTETETTARANRTLFSLQFCNSIFRHLIFPSVFLFCHIFVDFFE